MMGGSNVEIMDSDGFEHVTQFLEDIEEGRADDMSEQADYNVVSGDDREEKKNDKNKNDEHEDERKMKEEIDEGDPKAVLMNAARPTSETRPTWTRMHLRHLSVEVLKDHKIDYVVDEQDPDYVLIKRWVPEYEQDFLWAASRALRTRRNATHRGSNSPYPSRVRLDRASSPGIVEVRRASAGAELKLGINRMDFRDWIGLKYMEQRGKYVLDVAVENGKAVRVAINSEALRDELRIIIGAGVGLEISEFRKVLTGPWKVLVEYEGAIRQRLQKLEEMMKSKDAKLTDNSLEMDDKKPGQVDEDTRSETCKVSTRNPSYPCELCQIVFPPHQTPLECLDTRLAHLKCLVEFMDSDLKDVFELRQQIKDGSLKEIAFADLWHLFSPGDLIVTHPMFRAYRVFHTSGGRPRLSKPELFEKKPVCSPFNINCFYMGYDWKTVGPIHETLRISEYVGKKSVMELLVELDGKLMTERVTVWPLKMLSIDERMKKISHLISRGKKLRSLRQGDHKYYVGDAGEEVSNSSDDDDPRFGKRVPGYRVGPTLDMKKEREFLKSDVIIDNEFKFENKAIGLFDAIEFDPRETAENCTHFGVSNNQYVNDRVPRHCGCSDVVMDHVVDNDRAAKYKDDLHLLQPRDVNDELEDDFLMLLPPTIEGFVLEKNAWKMLNIEAIRDVKVEGMMSHVDFKDLVLPEGHESLLKALVRAHPSSKFSSTEKKQECSSLAILLHGPESTGKFLTVKALASHFNRPLYTITGMDFGISTRDSARELANHFKRATKWNCIIAIPGAEGRFPRRNTPPDGDFGVSGVLLSELELFNGIVVLTTVNKQNLEEQVVGRMNVCLRSEYWNLDVNTQIWHKMLKKRGIHDVEDNMELKATFEKGAYSWWLQFIEEEGRMGKMWNGTDINNFFDAALAMAGYNRDFTNESAPVLKTSHLDIAARAVSRWRQVV
ncbi:hypothetical protein OCU04_006588 [Sclerotinia nivalis]|uniref:ATPase AAA-type core domain-containing protein n=1 Tax=Sclerotinia nivalis TaxID=352851 RepID=A0A9X0AK23_9HELO|nr:hypothetical protein OCU04_006588 [Sclerotinia nivalis]